MFLAQLQLDDVAVQPRLRDRILGDNAAVIFYFDVEIVVWQHLIAELEDLCERARVQPVVDIIRHIGLQEAGVRRVVKHSSAINKSFCYVPHLCDVEMRGNLLTVG